MMHYELLKGGMTGIGKDLEESMSQDSSVSMTMDWMTRIQFMAGAMNFSSIRCFHSVSEAHQTSYPVGTWVHFSEGKTWSGHDADHFTPI
jgi:hypothetical protein